ncbi:MAG: redoxin family protein [Burkholderiales bacterium]
MRRLASYWLVLLLAVAGTGHAAGQAPAKLQGEIVTSGEDGAAAFDLAQHRGKVVVVNFWATWCPACRADMPVWQDAYEWYQDEDFEMVAVSIDRDPVALQRFLDKHSYTIPVVWRFDPREQDSFPKIKGTPTTFFIGRDGQIASMRQGRFDLYELTRTIDALLQH